MRNLKRNIGAGIGGVSHGKGATLLTAGVALAAAALVVRWKARQAEHEHPPLGQFIEIDGVRLHYVERGNGPPLVLLHGNGNMAEDFDISGLLDLAATRYRVIAFDRPGFGYSDRPRDRMWTPYAQAELLHRALQRLGIDKPIVAGHSWGTLVAIALALNHPDAVRSLVLLSGYYFPTVRLDVPLFSTPAIPVLGDLMRYTISPLLSRLMWPMLARRMFGPSPVPARFANFPIWLALRPSQIRASAAESALMIPAVFALRKRYGELGMPVTILAGGADQHIDAQQSAHLHDKLLQSELHLAPGVGHMVHYLVPHQIMSAIDAAAEVAERGAANMSPMQAQRPGGGDWQDSLGRT